jgi:hypothetical protein
MDIIKELWYGNVVPFEQCTRVDKQLKELPKLVARNKEELDASLTEKQKETLEKFEENMNEMHGITERDAFLYVFRLGVHFVRDVSFGSEVCLRHVIRNTTHHCERSEQLHYAKHNITLTQPKLN